MIVVYFFIFGMMLIFGSIAVYAIYWAAKSGQFENFTKGSEVIFDHDEPIGKVTDHFPKS